MAEAAQSAVWEAETVLEAHWQAREAWLRDVLGFKGWKDSGSTPDQIRAELVTLAETWPQVPASIQRMILNGLGTLPDRLESTWPTLPAAVRSAIIDGIGATVATLATAERIDRLEQSRRAGDASDSGKGQRPRRGVTRWKRRERGR